MTKEPHIPPMPEGFTDRTAWDAIHFQFGPLFEPASVMARAVMDWQKANQERVLAAIDAKSQGQTRLL